MYLTDENNQPKGEVNLGDILKVIIEHLAPLQDSSEKVDERVEGRPKVNEGIDKEEALQRTPEPVTQAVSTQEEIKEEEVIPKWIGPIDEEEAGEVTLQKHP